MRDVAAEIAHDEDTTIAIEKIELELIERAWDDEASIDIHVDWYTDSDSGVSEIQGFTTRMLDHEGDNIVYYGYGKTLADAIIDLASRWSDEDYNNALFERIGLR